MERQSTGSGLAGSVLQRSVMYRFLSLALRPPAEGFAACLGDAAWRAVLLAARRAGPESAAAASSARQACARLTPSRLAGEYERTFGHRVGIDRPPYEAQYAARDVFQQARCLADVAGFYRAFGLDVGEPVRERPDHISLELEFMHVLAFREGYARTHHSAEQVELLVDAQRAFLRGHLARWAPAFGHLVARTAGRPYGALAALLAAWVRADAQALDATPVDDLDLSTPAGALEGEAPACGGAQCPLEPQA